MIKRSFLFMGLILFSLLLTSCKRNTFIVTFDLNGGNGEALKQTVKKNGLAVEPENPTKDGFIFTGWFLGEEKFSFNTKITKNITLKVKWEDENLTDDMFYVVFDVNGGLPQPPSQDIKQGNKATKPANPTKEDFVFAGWYLGEVLFDFDEPVNEDVTLIALWEAVLPSNLVVTVTFDTDGGTPLIDEIVIDKGSKVTKPADPVKDGYTFEGWYYNNKKHNFNDVIDEDITLTAKWDKVVGKTYYVTFDTGGGIPNSIYETVSEGNKANKPADPTKDGHTFDGWFYNDSEYDFNALVTKDITIVAKWIKDEVTMYEIVFDEENGNPTYSVFVESGSKVSKPANPAKEGFIFIHWIDYAGIAFDFNKEITHSEDIFALWVENTVRYTVLFELNGGSPLIGNYTVWPGGRINEPESPSKVGFLFLGWYFNDVLFDFDTMPILKDMTLSAKWGELDNYFTVTFDTAGGLPVPKPLVVERGTIIELPEVPVKEGYEFALWFYFDQMRPWIFGQNKVTRDMTLTAMYNEVSEPEVYEVTFDEENGTPVYTVDVTEGEKVIKPLDPTRGVDVFLHWVDTEGNIFDFDSFITKNMNLFAVYEEYIKVEYFSEHDIENPFIVNILKGTIPEYLTTFERDGYTLVGYEIDNLLYEFDTPLDENTILKAKWEENAPEQERVTIFLSANGGKNRIDKFNIIKGTVPNKPADPIRDGYIFDGWHYGGIPFNFDEPVNQNITLIAQWEQYVYVRVIFIVEGSSQSYPNILIVQGDTAVRPEVNPTKEGFIFLGWTKEGSEDIYNFNSPVNEDMTLVAKFKEKSKSYSVRFYSEGGSPAYQSFIVSEGIKVPSPTTPTRENHNFLYWSDILENQFDLDTLIDKDYDLYAVWEDLNEYVTVTFDGNDGLPNLETVEVIKGTKVTKPADPTKKGYIFAGWHESGSGLLYDFNLPVDNNLYLLAQWTINEDEEYITIYYYTEHNENLTVHEEILKGTIPENKVPFTRSGYNFVRYEINGKSYNFDTPIYEDETYLEAVWEQKVQAYIGEVGYPFAYQAADNLLDGQTLSLTADYDGSEFEIYADNVLITRYKTQKAVVRENIYIYSENVKIKNLEFTDYAQIRFEDDVIEFRFEDNKVYDLRFLDNNDFNFNRRANVNSFIYFYHSTKYNLEDMVLLRNTFDNIKSTVILLAPESISGSLTFRDNKFTNIIHSAIRIDANSNGGNLYIENNIFENITHNAIFINGVGHEVKYTNFQIININKNEFYKISESTVKPDDSKLTRSVIIINDNIHEVPLNFKSEYNHFYLSSVAYYVDNAYDGSSNPIMKINNNHFEFIQWYALQQRYVKNIVFSVDVDFTKNTYQSFNYDNLEGYDDLVSSKIVNNGNYAPFYIDEALIYENEEVRHDAKIYVNSLLENNENDIINALGKTFIYGKTAFNNITEALNKAGDNDVIYLDPNGYYPEDFTILQSGITIISANAGIPYNDPNYTHVTAIIEGKISIRVNNVTIDGLRFSNQSTISIASITGELKGFKFLNNTVNNYFGDKEPTEAFIQTLYYPNQQTVNNIYLIGNTFGSNMNLVPYIGENVRNLYVINNNFQGKAENNNSAIILRGANGSYEGQGTTGRIFIARNIFNNFNGDVVNIDYYNHMNLKVMHNEFLMVANRGIRVNKTDLENDLRTDIRVFNNKFTSTGGVPSYIQLVEQVYPTTLRVEYNDFYSEARYYVQNTANTEFITVVNNLYRVRVSLSHFLNVEEFTEVEELPPYYGIFE